MAGNLNDFRASFNDYLARPSRFDVLIPVPITMMQYRSIAQQLTFRCENAEMPGRTFATLEQKIYGPTEKFPYQTTYNEMNMSFIVSDDMVEKMFFDAWMDIINPTDSFNFKYKGDYAIPITINQYDVTGEKSYSVDLVDAYPISVNQLDLDWASDGHHKLTVVMAYTSWRNNSVQHVIQGAVDAAVGKVVSEVTKGMGLMGNIVR